MENALWNDKLIMATEIAKDYQLEKSVRKASAHKELLCPDPECESPILRYCHGEVKEPFFAHISNDRCDYADFDRGNTQAIRTVRHLIYEHFKSKGFSVHLEVKVLDRHYTHILLNISDGQQIAIELGTHQTSANKIDSLSLQYQAKGIPVKWIIVDNPNRDVREEHTYFIKRYLFNESNNKDLIVISWDGTELSQYKADPQKYIIDGVVIHSENYPSTFKQSAPLSNLGIEDGELTLSAFSTHYQDWLCRKQKAFKARIAKEEKQRQYRQAESDRRMKEIHAQAVEKNRLRREEWRVNRLRQQEPSAAQITHRSVTETTPSPTRTIKPVQLSRPSDYEQRKQEILPLLAQQEMPAIDSHGTCWYRCKKCGAVEIKANFSSFGGVGEATIGICHRCAGHRG